MSEISVGILSPSRETADLLRAQVNATGLATVRLESEEYCVSLGDRATHRFIEGGPNIIIVDAHHPASALQTVDILHSALPETWLFVTADTDDPQMIIESMRAGAREFLPKPVTKQTLLQAVQRYLAERQKSNRSKRGGKIYCVTSAKCGVGVTSVAINTAVATASAPDTKVALLDLNNPLGDTTAFLNVKPQFTVDDAIAASSRLDGMLLDSYTTSANGISLLAGATNYHPGRKLPIPELARLLEVAAETYSQCFLDFPISLDEDYFRLAAEISSSILLVVTPDLPAIWRTERMIRFMQGKECMETTRLVINRTSKTDEIGDTEIEKAVNHSVFWKLPDDTAVCMDGVNSGKPVALADNAELARSYREMAHKLTGIAIPEKRRSLLSLFS